MESGKVLFTYSYSGGRPPASLEELYVRDDLLARYLVGNLWPRKGPLDEIGIYQRRLSGAEWHTLYQAIQAVCRDRIEAIDEPWDADAGVERIKAWLDGEPYTHKWDPIDLTDNQRALRGIVRTLASRLRENPLSVLQARLEAMPSKLALELHNRGRQPFTFYGFQAAAPEDQAQLRVQCLSLEDIRDEGPPSPIRLRALKPIPLSNPEGVETTGEGLVTLDPGEDFTVHVPGDVWSAPAASIPGAYTIHGLLYIRFQHIHGQRSFWEEGWPTPEPVTMFFGCDGNDETEPSNRRAR